MSNSHFAFKQFRIEQDRCAMKVSTDACIQGAWTPLPAGHFQALDIGAGTGLLSLMVAQRAQGATITGLELAAGAAGQAAENAAASPFAERVRIVRTDALLWKSSQRYEHIICNPPFFRNSLQGPDAARNSARHAGSLHPRSLSELIVRHLAPEGSASLLLPPAEFDTFTTVAQEGNLFLQRRLLVRDRETSRVNRVIGIFGMEQVAPEDEALVIKDADGGYTPEFRRLLAPFYLAL